MNNTGSNLISNNTGSNLISNNTGSNLISNNTGSNLISSGNTGGGLISSGNTGGSLISSGNTGGSLISSGNTSNTGNINPMISDICFLGGTLIKTDQGLIAIDKINTNIHTINNFPILYITKIIFKNNYLIFFEKNSLGNNIPSENTIISPRHKIFYNGKTLFYEC